MFEQPKYDLCWLRRKYADDQQSCPVPVIICLIGPGKVVFWLSTTCWDVGLGADIFAAASSTANSYWSDSATSTTLAERGGLCTYQLLPHGTWLCCIALRCTETYHTSYHTTHNPIKVIQYTVINTRYLTLLHCISLHTIPHIVPYKPVITTQYLTCIAMTKFSDWSTALHSMYSQFNT